MSCMTPGSSSEFQRAGAVHDLSGRWTLAGVCERVESLDLFPEPPANEVSRRYRVWAFESALLDLALQQAGRSLAEVLGPAGARDALRVLAAAREPPTPRAGAPAARARPGPALQAGCDQLLDRRADRRAGRDRSRRLDRLQGLLPGHDRRPAGRPAAVPAGRRGVPRCLARGPRPVVSVYGGGARRGARPDHLGCADHLVPTSSR